IKIQGADRTAYRTALQPVYDQFRPTIGAELMDAVLSQAG
ncbi:TRAP transporter substrate-binding protein DctP, partial [Neisseria gonorrhoeae]